MAHGAEADAAWHAPPVRPGAKTEGARPFRFQPLPLPGGSPPPVLMLLLTVAPPTFVTVVLPIDVAALLVEDIDIDDDEATPIALTFPRAKAGVASAASRASDIPWVLSLI